MAARSMGYVALCMGALATLVGAGGCADDGVSMHVICPIAPEIEDDACVYEAEGETCVGEGVMNLGATLTYRLNLRVESGLQPRARTVPPQGEPNGVQLRSARIELRDASGGPFAFPADGEGNAIRNPFTVPASGYVEPEGLNSISVTAIDAQRARHLLHPKTGALLFEQIVLSVKVEGVTNGGEDVSSGEFIWPVRLLKVSANPADSKCRTRAYCAGALGQDSFADACDASGTGG
jgi:hypothetical protein